MSGVQVIFFALSLAFVWVDILRWGIHKPFNCVKCMCGWFALLLAGVTGADYWYLYAPAGVFAGAMFEAIRMGWL